MTDYYLLLAVAIGGLMNATPERRAAVYDKARVAMTERLRSSSPPIGEAEIAKESQAFDEAVARLENELSPAPVPAPVARPAQRGARSNRSARTETPTARERPKAPPAPTRQEPFVSDDDVLAALRPTNALGLGEEQAPIVDRNERRADPEPIRAQRVMEAPPTPRAPFVATAPIAAAPPPTPQPTPFVATAPVAAAPPPPIVAMPADPAHEDRPKPSAVPVVAETEEIVAAAIEPVSEPERAPPLANQSLPDTEPLIAMAPEPQPIAEVVRVVEPAMAQPPVETKAEEPPTPAAPPETAPVEALGLDRKASSEPAPTAKQQPLLRLASSIAAIPEADRIKVESAPKPRASDLFKLKTVPAPPPKPQPKVEVKPKAVETPAKALPAVTRQEVPADVQVMSEAPLMSTISAATMKAVPKRMLRDEPLEMPLEQQPRAVGTTGRRAAPKVDTSWALPRWKTAPERRSSLSGVRPSSARALPPTRGPLTRQVAAQAVERGFGTRRTDRALIAAGVVMAFLSGAFGIFMNLPETEGLRQANEQAMALAFPIDADTTVADDDAATAPAEAVAPQQVAEAAPAQQAAAVDPVVTGSIAPAPKRVVRRIEIDNIPAADPQPAPDSGVTTPSLKDYHVRDVYQDMALIEGPHGLTLVKRGAKLQGAGTVTAIEKRDSKWVIDTSEGTIAEDSH